MVDVWLTILIIFFTGSKAGINTGIAFSLSTKVVIDVLNTINTNA